MDLNNPQAATLLIGTAIARHCFLPVADSSQYSQYHPFLTTFEISSPLEHMDAWIISSEFASVLVGKGYNYILIIGLISEQGSLLILFSTFCSLVTNISPKSTKSISVVQNDWYQPRLFCQKESHLGTHNP
jgi:hypothetical protein